MEGFASLLDAIATLAWPLLLGVLLFRLRHILSGVLESARSRRFTIKLAGTELTMEEAAEQQRLLISDLQEALVALEQRFQAFSEYREVAEPAFLPEPDIALAAAKGEEPERSRVRSILWVDDNPRNNASLIAHLEDLGVRVVTALTTADGIRQFMSGNFDRIITDIGREEDGEYRRDAGIELIRKVREEDPKVPVLVYTSSGGSRHRGHDARAAGAALVTSSPTSLLRGLNLGAT